MLSLLGTEERARAKGDRAFLGCWEAGALLQPRFGISGLLGAVLVPSLGVKL